MRKRKRDKEPNPWARKHEEDAFFKLRPGTEDQTRILTDEEVRAFLQHAHDKPLYDKLLQAYAADDQIQETMSSRQSWDELMGSHTLQLVRDGEYVTGMTLRMN